MTRLGRETSKAFRPGAQEIPWIDLGSIRGLKPRMAGTTWVPFWINPGDGSTTTGSAKTQEEKPLTAGIACPFFGASSPKSTSDSVISSIKTEVRGARGIFHKHSRKYLSQSFLDPINTALWLVLAWVFGWHRLAAMQSLLRMDSFSVQMISWWARL